MTLRTLRLGELDTNCYVIWDDNRMALVIDPADEADKILTLIAQENLTVTAVVLTHAHFDHLLAADEVCAATGAPLCVGQRDEEALADPVRNLSGLFQMCPLVTMAADVILMEGDVLKAGELSFLVMETPGHTPGCVCLMCNGVLFAGDTLFRDSIGRVDFPGSKASSMIESLRRLAKLPAETMVYSGHGEATTIGRELQRNPYMQRI